MLTIEELDALAARVPEDPDLAALLETLQRRAAPVLATLPHIPKTKALLSVDGGVCPDDRSPLQFDPWSPDRHTCPACGKHWSGDRHHRHWARAQHLWVAERAAELALLAALTREDRPAQRAAEILGVYEARYFELPNRDNVLGPSHLFFSTYLESLWLTSYLAAAFMLRETGALSEERIEGVNQVADEAARIIGEFDEGLSNRQTWHAAALTAISAWFGDQELGQSSVESRTGVIGHLMEGFGGDGLWWEGENYHLFALRGTLQGIHWAHAAGFDLIGDQRVRVALHAALLAPSRSALPDLTYPARRDARYGVSLAQPASLDLWEIGRAWLGGGQGLDGWLAALYGAPAQSAAPLLYDAWLHDAGLPPVAEAGRAGLSWWALTVLGPAPDSAAVQPWQPESGLLPDQGLGVLRHATTYASLECGRDIGGHGHPDRLHLTLHANGVHWLPDPGTGSYVEPELAWYRSALAHNAPMLDGVNAGGEDAHCLALGAAGGFSWCAARAGSITRCVVLAPDHLVDNVVVAGQPEVRFDLPWHIVGGLSITTPGTWSAAALDHPFVTGVERFEPAAPGPLQLEGRASDGRTLRALLLAPGGELWRATAPGLPGRHDTQSFFLLRALAEDIRWVTVLDWAPDAVVQSLTEEGGFLQVRTATGPYRYEFRENAVVIEHGGEPVELGGAVPSRPAKRSVFRQQELPGMEATVPIVRTAPALDGSLTGFDTRTPLSMNEEHQYRRSEDPYDPETFSAEAYVNWDGEALYVAVEVNKPDLMFRQPDAAPLLLDNEPDDIHSDGIQVFVKVGDAPAGSLIIPGPGGSLHSRTIGGRGLGIAGAWSKTATGYCVTFRVDDDRIPGLPRGARVGFDLLVNEMQEGRTRRAGQLVWGGSGGWIYLRGDRQPASDLGTLELG